MANLKDVIKAALNKKNGVIKDDGHEAVTQVEKTTTKKATTSKTAVKKPTARVTGRGR